MNNYVSAINAGASTNLTLLACFAPAGKKAKKGKKYEGKSALCQLSKMEEK